MSINNTVPNTLKAMYLFNSHLFQNEEIQLGANTMISGTNGVGKTTALSLLAFFATGDQRLFKNDAAYSKSFYDVFFKNNNSFIVYEYEKVEHNVLVAVYAKEGLEKLSFQFIALSKESYTVADIFNRDSRAEILNEIDTIALSTATVSSREYLKVLYGDSEKGHNIYMFSHVRNYDTYAKLHYAYFKNIAIDSTSIKNIIMEYVHAQDSMSSSGFSLERHGEEFELFLSEYSAIKEWKKRSNNIPKLRESLLNISNYEKRKINTLLKIRREWNWYVDLMQDTAHQLELKAQEIDLYNKEEYPFKKKELDTSLEEERKKVNSAEHAVKAIKEKMDEYQSNTDLQSMVKELPKMDEYESGLSTAKTILSALQEKNKSASEKHKEKLDALNKHLQETLKANNSFFTEQKNDFLSKKLNENARIKEAEEIARKDFSSIDILKEKLTASERSKNDFVLSQEKLKLKKFSDEERSIFLQQQKDEAHKNLLKLTKTYNELEQKEKDLYRDEETFAEGQRKSKEAFRIETNNALEKINENISKLDSLSYSADTLYSKVVKAGLNIQKYTGILNMEALGSNDFTISNDKNITGMQVFDFELSENTTLVERGKTLHEQKKLLEEEKEKIRQASKKREKAFEGEYSAFYAKNRSDWTLLKNERELIDATRIQYTENIEAIEEEKNKAEESWEAEQKILLENVSEKINSCSSESSGFRADIKKLENAYSDILTKIRSNLFDEKAAIKKAEEACRQKNEEAEKRYSLHKSSEEAHYKKVLDDSGVSGDEVSKYAELVNTLEKKIHNINKWEMKIREYESFLENEWTMYDISLMDLSQKRTSFDKISKEIESQQNILRSKQKSLESEFAGLKEKKRNLENKNSLLSRQISDYRDLLESESPLPEKTEQEKHETNLNTEADELLLALSSTIKVLDDEKNSLIMNISKEWGTFIAKGALLFATDPIENARIIVSADTADEMGVFANKAYLAVSNAIHAVAGYHITIQDALSFVKSAISRINKDLEDISSTSLIESIKLRAENKHSGIEQSMRELSGYWKLHSDNMQQNLFATDVNSSKHQEAILERLKDFITNLNSLSKKEKTISVGSLFDLQGKIIEKGNESGWEDGALGKGSEGTRILIKVAIAASLFSMALSGSKDKQIPLLLIDEIGKLHNDNVEKVLEYVNGKGSHLVAVQPNNAMAKFFSRAYRFDERSKTQTVIIEYLRKKIPLKIKSA